MMTPEVKEVVRALLTGMVFAAIIASQKRSHQMLGMQNESPQALPEDLASAQYWAGEILKTEMDGSKT